jgi:hypothetical protein
MTITQWFLFVILPCAVAVAGVLIGESFRAFYKNDPASAVEQRSVQTKRSDMSEVDTLVSNASSVEESNVRHTTTANPGIARLLAYGVFCGILGLALGWVLTRIGSLPV